MNESQNKQDDLWTVAHAAQRTGVPFDRLNEELIRRDMRAHQVLNNLRYFRRCDIEAVADDILRRVGVIK